MNEPETKCLGRFQSLLAVQIEKAKGTVSEEPFEAQKHGDDDDEEEDAGKGDRKRSSGNDSVSLSPHGSPLRLKAEEQQSPCLRTETEWEMAESVEQSQDRGEVLPVEHKQHQHQHHIQGMTQQLSAEESGPVWTSPSQPARKRKAPYTVTMAGVEGANLSPHKIFIVPATVGQEGQDDPSAGHCLQDGSIAGVADITDFPETANGMMDITEEERSEVSEVEIGRGDSCCKLSFPAPAFRSQPEENNVRRGESVPTEIFNEEKVMKTTTATEETIDTVSDDVSLLKSSDPDNGSNRGESLDVIHSDGRTTTSSPFRAPLLLQAFSPDTIAGLADDDDPQSANRDDRENSREDTVKAEHSMDDSSAEVSDTMRKERQQESEQKENFTGKRGKERHKKIEQREDFAGKRGKERHQKIEQREDFTGKRGKERNEGKEDREHITVTDHCASDTHQKGNDEGVPRCKRNKEATPRQVVRKGSKDTSEVARPHPSVRKPQPTGLGVKTPAARTQDWDIDCDFIDRLLTPLRGQRGRGQVSLFQEIQQAEQHDTPDEWERDEMRGRLPHPQLRMTQMQHDKTKARVVNEISASETDQSLDPQKSVRTFHVAEVVESATPMTKNAIGADYCKASESMNNTTDTQTTKQQFDGASHSAHCQGPSERLETRAAPQQAVDLNMDSLVSTDLDTLERPDSTKQSIEVNAAVTVPSMDVDTDGPATEDPDIMQHADCHVVRGACSVEGKQANYSTTEDRIPTDPRTSLSERSSHTLTNFVHDPATLLPDTPIQSVAHTGYLRSSSTFRMSFDEACLVYCMDSIAPVAPGSLLPASDDLMLTAVSTVVSHTNVTTVERVVRNQQFKKEDLPDRMLTLDWAQTEKMDSAVCEKDDNRREYQQRTEDGRNETQLCKESSRKEYQQQRTEDSRRECHPSEQLSHCLLTLNNNSLPSPRKLSRKRSPDARSTSGHTQETKSTEESYFVEYKIIPGKKRALSVDRHKHRGFLYDNFSKDPPRIASHKPRSMARSAPVDNSRSSVPGSPRHHSVDCKCLDYDCLRRRGEMLHSHVMKNLDVLKQFAADRPSKRPNYSIHIKEAAGSKARDLIRRQQAMFSKPSGKLSPVSKSSETCSEQKSSAWQSSSHGNDGLSKGLVRSLPSKKKLTHKQDMRPAISEAWRNRPQSSKARPSSVDDGGLTMKRRKEDDGKLSPQRPSTQAGYSGTGKPGRVSTLIKSADKPCKKQTSGPLVQTNQATAGENCAITGAAPQDKPRSAYFFSVEVPGRQTRPKAVTQLPNPPQVVMCRELDCETKHIVTRSGQQTVTSELEQRQYNPSSKSASSYYYSMSRDHCPESYARVNRGTMSFAGKQAFRRSISEDCKDKSRSNVGGKSKTVGLTNASQRAPTIDTLLCDRIYTSSQTQTPADSHVTVAVQTSPPPAVGTRGDQGNNATVTRVPGSVQPVTVDPNLKTSSHNPLHLSLQDLEPPRDDMMSYSGGKKTPINRQTMAENSLDNRLPPSRCLYQQSTSKRTTSKNVQPHTQGSLHSQANVIEDKEMRYKLPGGKTAVSQISTEIQMTTRQNRHSSSNQLPASKITAVSIQGITGSTFDTQQDHSRTIKKTRVPPRIASLLEEKRQKEGSCLEAGVVFSKTPEEYHEEEVHSTAIFTPPREPSTKHRGKGETSLSRSHSPRFRSKSPKPMNSEFRLLPNFYEMDKKIQPRRLSLSGLTPSRLFPSPSEYLKDKTLTGSTVEDSVKRLKRPDYTGFGLSATTRAGPSKPQGAAVKKSPPARTVSPSRGAAQRKTEPICCADAAVRGIDKQKGDKLPLKALSQRMKDYATEAEINEERPESIDLFGKMKTGYKNEAEVGGDPQVSDKDDMKRSADEVDMTAEKPDVSSSTSGKVKAADSSDDEYSKLSLWAKLIRWIKSVLLGQDNSAPLLRKNTSLLYGMPDTLPLADAVSHLPAGRMLAKTDADKQAWTVADGQARTGADKQARTGADEQARPGADKQVRTGADKQAETGEEKEAKTWVERQAEKDADKESPSQLNKLHSSGPEKSTPQSHSPELTRSYTIDKTERTVPVHSCDPDSFHRSDQSGSQDWSPQTTEKKPENNPSEAPKEAPRESPIKEPKTAPRPDKTMGAQDTESKKTFLKESTPAYVTATPSSVSWFRKLLVWLKEVLISVGHLFSKLLACLNEIFSSAGDKLSKLMARIMEVLSSAGGALSKLPARLKEVFSSAGGETAAEAAQPSSSTADSSKALDVMEDDVASIPWMTSDELMQNAGLVLYELQKAVEPHRKTFLTATFLAVLTGGYFCQYFMASADLQRLIEELMTRVTLRHLLVPPN